MTMTQTDVLDRVRKLLAKAESTTFESEAEAFFAKASALMTEHALDEALLRDGKPVNETPVHVTLKVPAPYTTPKVTILSAVAKASRCQVVWSNRTSTAHLFGFATDVEYVQALWTSLLSFASQGAMRQEGDPYRYRNNVRAVRAAFLTGFAARIGQRLQEANREAEQSKGMSMALVLADRSALVRDAMKDAFPKTVQRRSTVGNRSGYYAGQAHANRYSFAKGVSGGRSQALGR